MERPAQQDGAPQPKRQFRFKEGAKVLFENVVGKRFHGKIIADAGGRKVQLSTQDHRLGISKNIMVARDHVHAVRRRDIVNMS